jgi:hypothetical protein
LEVWRGRKIEGKKGKERRRGNDYSLYCLFDFPAYKIMEDYVVQDTKAR